MVFKILTMINYTAEPESNLIIITTDECVDLTTALGMVNDLRLQPDFHPNINRLFDFTEAVIDLTMEDMKQLVHFIRQYVAKTGDQFKLAMVLNDGIEDHFFALYQLLRDAPDNQTLRMFHDVDSARAWLMKST